MIICKKYEIKKGHVLYRREFEFKSIIHEICWKFMMKRKGCIIKEFINQ